jgi:hypothetical protein
MSSRSELQKSSSPLSQSPVSTAILSRSRLSSSRRLTSSSAKTESPLPTPNQLKPLFTFTNAQGTQTSPTIPFRHPQSSNAVSSLSASLESPSFSQLFPTCMEPNISSSFPCISLPTFDFISPSISVFQPSGNIFTATSETSTSLADIPIQVVRRYRARTGITQLPLARRYLVPQQSYRHGLEPCNVVCSACNSMHWIEERSSNSSKSNPMFIMCCGKGRISLPPLNDAPVAIRELLTNRTSNRILSICPHLIRSWY